MKTSVFFISLSLLILGLAANSAANTGLSPSPGEKAEASCVHPDSVVLDSGQGSQAAKHACPDSKVEEVNAKKTLPPVTADKKEEQAPAIKESAAKGEQFSTFSFLYYLFYKFNLNDFSSTPAYRAGHKAGTLPMVL
jgi:hypothetical protein